MTDATSADGSRLPGPGREIITRRHPEWVEHVTRWRWLLDSFEGGDRYRQAIYGIDTRGLPVRNLIRHKREYPEAREGLTVTTQYLGGLATDLAGMVGMISPGVIGPGVDPASRATDDDYEMRRARTPVPTFVAEVVGIHLGKVYSKEVDRDVPDTLGPLKEWMADVDGIGTPLDEWMSVTIAPLLLTLGLLDIALDHPAPPEGEPVVSQYDERRLKLIGCVASYVLPENMVWWRLDARHQYAEALVEEVADPDCLSPEVRWRHWTATESTVYDAQGEVVSTHPHRFGRVPITRLMDRRKPRCRNVGKPRYEGIAERQREYYNRDSELILSDTTQAHPLLQGPEDYVQADGSIPIGPSWLLPKKKNSNGGAASYEGFDVIDFPKDGADSIRRNKADIREDVDRDGALTKPAGAAGTTGGTVAQSGISKQLDNQVGHAILTDIAKMLAKAERTIIGLALVVLSDDAAAASKTDQVTISYPMVFDLASADELVTGWTGWQALLAGASSCTETQLVALTECVRKLMPGRSDKFYETAADEIRTEIEANAERSDQMAELRMTPPDPAGPALSDATPGGPLGPPVDDQEAGDPEAQPNPKNEE